MQIVPHIRCVGGNLLHFLYPDCCHGCGQRLIGSEKFLCGDCLGRLTYTGYEKQPKNPLAASMQSKIPIRGASALLFFNKEGVIQKLLHELKYQGQAEIGLFLGCLAGQLLGHPPFLRCRLSGPRTYASRKTEKTRIQPKPAHCPRHERHHEKTNRLELFNQTGKHAKPNPKKQGIPMEKHPRQLHPEPEHPAKARIPPPALPGCGRCCHHGCHFQQLLPGAAQDSRRPGIFLRHSTP